MEPATRACLYCHEACETDLLSSQPVLVCIWCQAVAHVSCYRSAHPQLAVGNPMRSGASLDAALADGYDSRTDIEGNSDYETQSIADDGGSPVHGGKFPAFRWRGALLEAPDAKEKHLPARTQRHTKYARWLATD